MSVGATAAAAARPADAGCDLRGAAARATDAVLRRADTLRHDARGSGLHAGQSARSGCAVRLGRGSACPSMSAIEWKKRFGVDILDGIGSTEMLHIFLSNQPGKLRYGTSGVAVPGYDARIVDENGRGRGRRRAWRAFGARYRPRRTATGTSARSRAAPSRASGPAPATSICASRMASIAICGRNDDMFKVSGLWVSPFDVESRADHASAPCWKRRRAEGRRRRAAAAEGVHHAEGRRQRHGRRAAARALKEHVKQQIGMWKYPRWIEFVDSLPKTATGKIQRFKLRE